MRIFTWVILWVNVSLFILHLTKLIIVTLHEPDLKKWLICALLRSIGAGLSVWGFVDSVNYLHRTKKTKNYRS